MSLKPLRQTRSCLAILCTLHARSSLCLCSTLPGKVVSVIGEMECQGAHQNRVPGGAPTARLSRWSREGPPSFDAGGQMIIEFLVLHDEAVTHAEHVLSCRDEQCDDIAHLHDHLTARYAGLAEVFVFVAGTARGHQYRLNRARARIQREALQEQQQLSLEAIRQAWDEGERAR